MLQRILRGRLTFTPHVNAVSNEVDGYDFAGPTRFDKLFTGLAVPRPGWLTPGDVFGCEDIGPEATGEGDYGRLLEAAHAAMRKGYCARRDSNPRPTASKAGALSN